MDANGNPYNYNDIVTQFGAGGFTYANRKAIRKALKDMLDGSYETIAQRINRSPLFLAELPSGRCWYWEGVWNSNFPTNSISHWKTKYPLPNQI